MDLKNKTVLVIGIGNSGFNACLLLHDLGASVKATDASSGPSVISNAKKLEDKGIDVETGGHTEGFIAGSDLVVISPGVEDSSPALKWAKSNRIPIMGEMELGSRFCKGKIIGITGTNGKSTVTTLIGEILKDAGLDTVVCGNIGNSLCGEIPRIKNDTWVVLEVSSFQLETINSFKPYIALILNITDDHMDRYSKFDEYFKEKVKIFANQDERDILILNYDAKNLRSLKDKASSKVYFYSKSDKANGSYDIKIRGLHNLENVLASVLVGRLAGVKEESMKRTIAAFKGLKHRIELVDTVDEVEYIDDSKGTTVDSTYRALEACDRPMILIAGGKDKHSDYAYVKDIVRKKVKDLILIGEAAGAIKKALKGSVAMHEARDMFEAVSMAHGLAKKGWSVILSPMCSSFDMFKDYKERGDVFRKAVGSLKKSSQPIRV
ncbi:MAG: UDP-N-acetylmuramoyl-L-alanine--D-glutamate ligase [Candidatus Omnitrophota bacterium]|jgi:UDP-N-acetylmuramoylalanine--D-glutamate ligase